MVLRRPAGCWFGFRRLVLQFDTCTRKNSSKGDQAPGLRGFVSPLLIGFEANGLDGGDKRRVLKMSRGILILLQVRVLVVFRLDYY
jgi:hypothetical protein